MAKRASSKRTQRAQLEALAHEFVFEPFYDTLIIGGGASGLCAAISAAERGARTCIIERGLSCGQSILATGGGRCNFSNHKLDSNVYRSASFVNDVIGETPLNSILDFFRSSGLAWSTEGDYFYPRSFSAASVRDVLLARARQAGVQWACARSVDVVEQDGDSWILHCSSQETVRAASVIIASGGGSKDYGLGLVMLKSSPVLCPLACTGLPFSKLDGKRVRAQLTLIRNGNTVHTEYGEVLFRSYGLSGIVTFNISRHAHEGDTLVIDFAPELDESMFAYLIKQADGAFGIVDPVIAESIGTEKTVELVVVGPAHTEHAQVTRGGFACSSFDPSTLMAATKPGLFACGEALDVDGPCGGYNLSWAWLSGMKAGMAAATWVMENHS